MDNVTIQTYDEPYQKPLAEWSITGYPFDDYEKVQQFMDTASGGAGVNGRGMAVHGPVVLQAVFDVPVANIHDTYINMNGWGKGFIFVNGFNLGRYWPVIGPQVTLYLPKELLKESGNTVVVVELQKMPTDRILHFSSKAILDEA